ncbi:MAG: class I SAM-dependent methyltransferase [Desulfobacterales bacterium]|nr:class I SAM-dependent methyltransferase [Desulfobacterales bacterium]
MAVTRRDTREPGIEAMGALFARCGIELTNGQLDRFWVYHCLLREHNPELNLTRVHNFANMVLKLYVDSVLPATMTALPSPLLDLGSGPGMPGIPLKICRPGLDVVLAETRGSRVDFLKTAIERLRLDGIRVSAGRVTARFEEPVAGVITRAVETIGRTLERVRGCLAEGGRVIFMKGPRCDAEIGEARIRFGSTYSLDEDRSYLIPGTGHARRLLVYRRLDQPLSARRIKAMSHPDARAIASSQNPVFKELKKLLSGRGIRKSGQALVAGEKLVRETLLRRRPRCKAWVSGPDRPPPAAGADLPWYQLAPELLGELDIFGTRSPLLLITVPEIRPWQPREGFPAGCSVLIPFQDPENVGAAIRSAAAFGASQAILLAESAHPLHPKAMRASGASVLDLPLRQGPSLADLPAELAILALSAEGADIRQAAFPEAFGLLAGLEGTGLPEAWRRRSLRIPIRPEVESLNAAAATAVALYEWKRRASAAAVEFPEPYVLNPNP